MLTSNPDAALTVVYALALAGMAGVARVPANAVRVAIAFLRDRTVSVAFAWLLLLECAAPLLIAMALGLHAVPKTLGCLGGQPCSASRSGGLMELAVFGLAVVVLELAVGAARLVRYGRRPRGSAT